MYLTGFTGRGVRVAIVDSGVHALHPHVAGVEQGVGIRDDGTIDRDFVDRLGHGTAVAAAIREKAPDAAIIAVKIFRDTLATDARSLVRGLDEACARGAHVINLSLGTSNPAHRALLESAVRRAVDNHAIVVAASEDAGVAWLPGCLDDVVGVRLDWTCERDAYRLTSNNGRVEVVASGYPRDIPNVPRERNLKGTSFAVANASGFVVRAVEACGAVHGARASAVLDVLERGLQKPVGST